MLTLLLLHDQIRKVIKTIAPRTIGNLSMLTRIYMHYNYLTGTLPLGVGNLSRLQQLQLHFNAFSGSIPDTFTSLTSLTYLRLDGNELLPIYPSGLCSMSISTFWLSVSFSDECTAPTPIPTPVPSVSPTLTYLPTTTTPSTHPSVDPTDAPNASPSTLPTLTTSDYDCSYTALANPEKVLYEISCASYFMVLCIGNQGNMPSCGRCGLLHVYW